MNKLNNVKKIDARLARIRHLKISENFRSPCVFLLHFQQKDYRESRKYLYFLFFILHHNKNIKNKYAKIIVVQGKKLKVRIMKPTAVSSINFPTDILSNIRKKNYL